MFKLLKIAFAIFLIGSTTEFLWYQAAFGSKEAVELESEGFLQIGESKELKETLPTLSTGPLGLTNQGIAIPVVDRSVEITSFVTVVSSHSSPRKLYILFEQIKIPCNS